MTSKFINKHLRHYPTPEINYIHKISLKKAILDFYRSNIDGFIAFSIKVGIFEVFCDVDLKINICIVENPIQVLKFS